MIESKYDKLIEIPLKRKIDLFVFALFSAIEEKEREREKRNPKVLSYKVYNKYIHILCYTFYSLTVDFFGV